MAMTTRTLLRAGMLAGPVYLLVGYTQAFTREGFDIRHHPLSLLSNGDLGWIQVLNFLVSGAMVIAGAAGVRQVLRGSPAGKWGPVLFALFGAGMLGGGLFKADPAPGFPPGTPEVTISQSGIIHFMFGAIAFYALIAACFVFARRFRVQGENGWALISTLTGLVFFVTFAVLVSGRGGSAAMFALYIVVTWSFLWHSAVHRKLFQAGGAS
jgi:Protein of unknown function (DUF998)